ncbi:transmembrane protein 88B [Amia ocellicauda]|uniref:transmembrane protein 88B n=1 Tax=Amia ocellicauda TaxID=2972642 RepID=UPI003463D3B3
MCDSQWECDGDSGAEGEQSSARAWLLPPPPAYRLGSPGLPRARRGRVACLVWGAGLVLLNGLVCVGGLVLLGVVFSLVLLPAAALLTIGFQCHSRVLHSQQQYCVSLLDDNSSSALIILGFVMMSPLLVVAMVIYCSLARRLRLFRLFQPCARALYSGGSWRGCEEYGGGGGCLQGERGGSSVKAWV